MALSIKHKIFADEVIKGRTPQQAYAAAYPKAKPTSCRVESYKLLQKPTIDNYIKEQAGKIAALAQGKAVEELKDKLVADTLTTEEKKRILADIATGKLLYKTYEPVYDDETGKYGTKPITVAEPTLDQRIKAIATHNLMVGDNAPTKIAATTKDGEDVTPYKITLNLT